MTGAVRKKRLLWLGGAGVVVIVGATIAYLLTRGSAQPEVTENAIPTVATAHRAAGYVDCSRLNGIFYDPHNPCQTFVLLQSRHFASAQDFLQAEWSVLLASGWRHSAPQLIDYDAAPTAHGLASPTESWVAPDHHVCAYLETAQSGVAAEGRQLFPYDPYNQPQGVLHFYLKAKAARQGVALWVRLRPPNPGGHCID
jgi:hypothetical protein